MVFKEHSNFSSKIFLADFPLCRVMLENNKHYPWLLLIPRRPDVSRMMQLCAEDQLQLVRELDYAQNVLWDLFQPTQLNVAALGNKTPQLHIHVIARFENDPAWPQAVWDHPVKEKYPTECLSEMQATLQRYLATYS